MHGHPTSLKGLIVTNLACGLNGLHCNYATLNTDTDSTYINFIYKADAHLIGRDLLTPGIKLRGSRKWIGSSKVCLTFNILSHFLDVVFGCLFYIIKLKSLTNWTKMTHAKTNFKNGL